MDGQAALVGGGVLVGGVYGGAGVVSLAGKWQSKGYAKLAADLDARGSMPGEEFLSRVGHYNRTVKTPTNLLRNAGIIVTLGSVVIGGAILGEALLGGD